MLPKKLKLPVQEMISKKGRAYRAAPFTIKVFSSDKPHSRFGVIVSKQISKAAVVRNKIKRMIFNALALAKDKWPIADYLIIASQPIATLNQEQINDKLISHAFN